MKATEDETSRAMLSMPTDGFIPKQLTNITVILLGSRVIRKHATTDFAKVDSSGELNHGDE